MTNPRYRYQTIQVNNSVLHSGGPSARGAALGSAVKLLHKASIALNRWAVSARVNREIGRLAGDIEQSMIGYEERIRQSRADTGVLVVVGIQEWKKPDFTGNRAQSFLSIHTAGVGNNPRQVLRRQLSTSRISQGAPRGWRRKDAYIWVTRN